MVLVHNKSSLGVSNGLLTRIEIERLEFEIGHQRMRKLVSNVTTCCRLNIY